MVGCLTSWRTYLPRASSASASAASGRMRVEASARLWLSTATTASTFMARSLYVRTASLEGDLGEAAQLAAVQPVHPLLAQQLERADPAAQVLLHPLPVEVVGHAGKLDLPVQGLVAHAQQRAVGHAEPEAVGRDRRGLHVERDRAAL